MSLKNKINDIFIKYDIIGAIKSGAPLDEYNLESGKIYNYLEKNNNLTENEIYQELVKIIKDWFGLNKLHVETLKILKLMSEEIYFLYVNK